MPVEFVWELMRVIEKLLPLAVIHTNRHMHMIYGKWKTLCNVVIVCEYWNAVLPHLFLSLLLDLALTFSSSLYPSVCCPWWKGADLATLRLTQDTVDTGYYFKYSLEDQHSGFKKIKVIL